MSELTNATSRRSAASAADRVSRFLVIGRIVGPVGLAGEVRARILTDFPDRYLQLDVVQVGDNLRPYAIESARIDGDTVILKLAGIDDADAARALRNADLQIPIERAVRLPSDQYYVHQIVGLDVFTAEGRRLGKITDILRTGSNDVYVVRSASGELLIPAIEDVVKKIDLDQKKIIVHLLPGIEEAT